jgi:hypothetical protein
MTIVEIIWQPEDVQALRPEMTLEEADEWLDRNRKSIIDRSIEYGYGVMETLLEMDE